MGKLIVYTCVTNGYDAVRRPSSIPGWADWKAFSDADFKDNRRPKLLPHEVFPEYDYSLWIDGNIDIVSEEFWAEIARLISEGVLYAGIPHPQRDDVYEESVRILKNDRAGAKALRHTVRHLIANNLPRHFGLNENSLVLRRHNDPRVVAFDKLWWEKFCSLCRRDQMTWPLCVLQTALPCSYILPKGSNIREHPWFRYTPHGKVYKKNLIKDGLRRLKVSLYTGWLERQLKNLHD